MILLFALACTPTPDEASTVPYILPESQAEPPSLDGPTVVAEVTDLVASLLTLNATPVVDAYWEVMGAADGGCPYYYPYMSEPGLEFVYWYDDCASGAGSRFVGASYEGIYTDYESGGFFYNGTYLFSQFDVDTAEGQVLHGNGEAAVYQADAADGTMAYFMSYLDGDFSWTGATGSWLGSGLLPALTLQVLTIPELGSQVYVDGGASGLGGSFDTIIFDGLVLTAEALGSDCGDEPGGSVLLRDAEGNWYDILFDGPDVTGTGGDGACDGCGTAWFEGSNLGPVCMDFSALLAWEDRPW